MHLPYLWFSYRGGRVRPVRILANQAAMPTHLAAQTDRHTHTRAQVPKIPGMATYLPRKVGHPGKGVRPEAVMYVRSLPNRSCPLREVVGDNFTPGGRQVGR